MDNWNESDEYLQRQSGRESSARSYPRRFPLVTAKASGMELTSVDGDVYLDCLAGAGTLALGHNHPAATEAMRNLLDNGAALHLLDLPSPIKDEFTTELFASLPPHFTENARIQFCGPSGADAVEAALKLVKTATGRRSIVAFQGGYHGMTHGSLSITGETAPKQHVSGLMSEVHFAPFPATYRCSFGIGGEDSARISAQYLADLFENPQSGVTHPAGVIVEVVQGEGGCRPAPNEWLRELRRITTEHDVPLIIDEIQTGLGRTGTMWAFEQAGIVPDVVCMSKAIGGGQPLAVVVYNEKLDQWKPGAHAGTFRGNQLAMAAGLATIREVRKEGLAEWANIAGDRLRSGLCKIQERTEAIGEVRGRGLMLGVEIVDRHDPRPVKALAPELARAIQQECFARKLVVELGGRHGSVVRFLPPLIITAEQVDDVIDRFGTAVDAALAIAVKN